MARLKVWHLLLGLITAATAAEATNESSAHASSGDGFEYRSVVVTSEGSSETVAASQLMHLGSQGWELVSYESSPHPRYRFRRPR